MMWHVVVVDSDAGSAEMIKKLVEASGRPYLVTATFEDGEEAYKYLCGHPQHVLITDICVPGLSGLELIRRVRSFDKDLKCIILSSYKVFEYAQQAMRLDVSAYLLKPLEQEKLYEVLLI